MAAISLLDHRLILDDDRLVDPRSAEPDNSIPPDRLDQAIQHSFDNPLGFPPIAQAVMREDSIAIVVEPDTPCGLDIADRVARWFVDLGNEPGQIDILTSERLPTGFSNTRHSNVRVTQHDATDSEQLAYLLADESGHPVYTHRLLHQADVVIPIGTGDGGRSINSLCPEYCDSETRQRAKKMQPTKLAGLSRMVCSNLGVFWQVRLVTAPGERIVQITTGESENVLEQTASQGTVAWQLSCHEPASMIVATIEPASSQTWQHLRTGLVTADKFATTDAILVMVTDLAGKPPASWPTGQDTGRTRDDELAAILGRHHVYLLSRLDQDTTEQLGFGFVKKAEHIERLIQQHSSCLLLRDAHRVGYKDREMVK